MDFIYDVVLMIGVSAAARKWAGPRSREALLLQVHVNVTSSMSAVTRSTPSPSDNVAGRGSDVVMVKGSLATGMACIVEALLGLSHMARAAGEA